MITFDDYMTGIISCNVYKISSTEKVHGPKLNNFENLDNFGGSILQ